MEGRMDGRKDGQKDGGVTIFLRNFVGEGIISKYMYEYVQQTS
jgi:hypothetical protein